MVMALIWTLILCLYITGPAQAVDLSEASFVSAKPGEAVTLHCKFVKQFTQNNWVWYKQRAGQEPQEVALKLPDKRKAALSSDRFRINQNFSLTIEQTTKDDEGMYFCGKEDKETITFSHGTFLAVTGQPQLNVSVLQTPAWSSVSSGESFTLQCMVHSKTGPAELRVLWFRAEEGQSFPKIIYTHQSRSSRQCEISSSTTKCVHNFSKNNFSDSDAGTYYCAVAACGKIIVSNGASVELKGPLDPVVLCLGAALGVCVVVISAQAFIICQTCQSVIHSFPEILQDQDSDAEEFSFAPLVFSDKRRLLKENAFTRVRFFPVSDFKPIQKHNIAEKRRK